VLPNDDSRLRTSMAKWYVHRFRCRYCGMGDSVSMISSLEFWTIGSIGLIGGIIIGAVLW